MDSPTPVIISIELARKLWPRVSEQSSAELTQKMHSKEYSLPHKKFYPKE
jgi:hypothetical protein